MVQLKQQRTFHLVKLFAWDLLLQKKLNDQILLVSAPQDCSSSRCCAACTSTTLARPPQSDCTVGCSPPSSAPQCLSSTKIRLVSGIQLNQYYSSKISPISSTFAWNNIIEPDEINPIPFPSASNNFNESGSILNRFAKDFDCIDEILPDAFYEVILVGIL